MGVGLTVGVVGLTRLSQLRTIQGQQGRVASPSDEEMEDDITQWTDTDNMTECHDMSHSPSLPGSF